MSAYGSGLSEALPALALFGAVAVIVAVAIWQFAATRRARIGANREEEYRAVAREAERTRDGTENRLAELTTRLGAMESRVESIERILREVE